MKRFALVLAALAALAPMPAAAQMVPGTRAPTDVRDAVRHAWLFGCFFAASGRPAAGLNLDFELAGEGLHPPTAVPAELIPLIMSLAGHVRPAVLEAPGGQVWIFFDAETSRCMIVPTPVTAEGIDTVLGELAGPDDGWTEVRLEGSGATAFEQEFPNVMPGRGRRPIVVRVWYQPAAAPEQPQMIVTEGIQRSRN